MGEARAGRDALGEAAAEAVVVKVHHADSRRGAQQRGVDGAAVQALCIKIYPLDVAIVSTCVEALDGFAPRRDFAAGNARVDGRVPPQPDRRLPAVVVPGEHGQEADERRRDTRRFVTSHPTRATCKQHYECCCKCCESLRHRRHGSGVRTEQQQSNGRRSVPDCLKATSWTWRARGVKSSRQSWLVRSGRRGGCYEAGEGPGRRLVRTRRRNSRGQAGAAKRQCWKGARCRAGASVRVRRPAALGDGMNRSGALVNGRVAVVVAENMYPEVDSNNSA